MKLQISYDFTNLSQALEIAKQTAAFADILEVGTPLLLSEGINAIREFKKHFPDKQIVADAKLVDRVDAIIPVLAKTGANHVTILYGTNNKVIQKASSIAHSNGVKLALDLIDDETMAQGAHDAKALGVDYVLFHYPHTLEGIYSHLDMWELVRGNTDLPVFISGSIAKHHVADIIVLKPQGIIIGEAITMAKEPAKEAEYFKEITK